MNWQLTNTQISCTSKSMKMHYLTEQMKLERINWMTHGFGLLLGLMFVPLLIYKASGSGIDGLLGSIVYSLSLILLYFSSTIYHSVEKPKLKSNLQILDHISIYFLIAGTYTPFILIYVNNATGFGILIFLWSMTLAGSIFKLFWTHRFNLLSTIIYLLMGWAMLISPKIFLSSIPDTILVLLAVGGMLYTLGVIFYLWKRYKYHHAIWHLFVLSASICHFVAVFLAMGA